MALISSFTYVGFLLLWALSCSLILTAVAFVWVPRLVGARWLGEPPTPPQEGGGTSRLPVVVECVAAKPVYFQEPALGYDNHCDDGVLQHVGDVCWPLCLMPVGQVASQTEIVVCNEFVLQLQKDSKLSSQEEKLNYTCIQMHTCVHGLHQLCSGVHDGNDKANNLLSIKI
jgi:hypothetical protein